MVDASADSKADVLVYWGSVRVAIAGGGLTAVGTASSELVAPDGSAIGILSEVDLEFKYGQMSDAMVAAQLAERVAVYVAEDKWQHVVGFDRKRGGRIAGLARSTQREVLIQRGEWGVNHCTAMPSCSLPFATSGPCRPILRPPLPSDGRG